MMDYNLEIGASYTAEKIVGETDSAVSLGSGTLPVFATPAMILLMELAACQSVQDRLPEGVTTVGTMVSIQHLAATPLGAAVSATATLAEAAGRKLAFEVVATDANGIIGKGLHERTIVDVARFMSKIKGI